LIYTVVSTDVNPYIDWQCELLEYTWRRAAQPGELIRIVTCTGDVPLPRHRHARPVRMTPHQSAHDYKPFERPEGTVLVVDPDVVFRRAIAGEASRGAPRAQLWVDYTPVSPRTQAATWPMLIHTADLEGLLPRWISFTAAIHRATHRWESDMHALVSAAAASGLTFSLEAIAAFVGWPDQVVGECPLVHYCQDVVSVDGEVLWTKRSYRPWARVPGAGRARHGYCRDLLALVDEYAGSVS
jgi:hypothetical protein